MNEEEMPPFWWHPHGMDMLISQTPESVRETTHTAGACHIKFFKNSGNDSYVLTTHAFRNPKNYRSDLERPLNGAMLATAYDLVRDYDDTDKEYALRFDADFGIPGVYLRKGKYVIFGGIGHGLETDPFPCLYLRDFLQNDIDRLRRLFIPA
ncbi:MAG: hypothetical protein JWO00_209 [Candidatus Parcubacteria bacterium]|nr:hypothetical protein [Candidatus Parcubacteria bacterium]